MNDKGAGFGHDTNKITIITENDEQEYDLKSKSEVASDILNHIEKKVYEKVIVYRCNIACSVFSYAQVFNCNVDVISPALQSNPAKMKLKLL